MKMSNTTKVVLILIVSAIIMLSMVNAVFAVTDLTNTLANTLTNNTTNSVTNNITNNTASTNNIAVLNTNAVNNTSTYNNTSLPNTGIVDSAPITIFIVVLGISAVYAYKKIQDYKNI